MRYFSKWRNYLQCFAAYSLIVSEKNTNPTEKKEMLVLRNITSKVTHECLKFTDSHVENYARLKSPFGKMKQKNIRGILLTEEKKKKGLDVYPS